MKNVRDFRELYPGDLVEYEAELGDRGFHAVGVKVIEPAQTAAG
jgi:cold shock CspA family protein